MESEKELNKKVCAAQTDQLFEQSSAAVIGGLMVALGVAVGLSWTIPWTLIGPWLVAVLIIGFARLKLIAVYRGRGKNEPEKLHWRNIHALAAALSGLCWGVGGFVFWPETSGPERLIFPVCIVALSSAAITTYCTDKASFLLFIFAALGPISARLISEGETAHMALGALGCLFIVFLSEIGNRTHKTNTDSFKALVKSQHLVGALSEEKYKSDVLNRRLQREIEERKDQEARIRRAKDDWERTFDATPDLITILDKNHRIVRANRPTLEKFGMDSDDVLGAQCFTLFHGTDRAPDNCPNNLLLKDGAPHCAEIFEERLNGIYNVSVSPLFNGNGALVGSVHVARDITDQKNTQKSLERIHKELEMMVRDRTEDLMNANVRLEEEVRQRQSAEKRIMASLKEKEILLQEIHHRVKNNLQIISSLVGLQESNIDEQGVLEALRDSKNRIKSMSLIHELLYQSSNLGRIEVAGYLRQLSKDLCRSYSDVLGRVDVRVSASKKRMGMDTAVPCGLIVNELVSNCLKHAFSDCRTGVVDVCFCEQDGSNYEISVSDNGKGLPGHVDFNSSRSLGLRLVRELAVNQLKGSVDISVNGGTRVTITFKERISPDGRAK